MSDVFGGFPPPPLCLFILTGTGWSRVSTEPPLAHSAPASSRAMPCWWALLRFPWEDEEEGQHCTLGMRLIAAQKTELIKTAFPRSASIQAVPTRGGFQGRTKAAFISHRRCDPCSSERYPAHCSSQPCPTRVSPAPLPRAALRGQVKIHPPSRESGLCPLFTLVSLYFQPSPFAGVAESRARPQTAG